MAKMKRSTKRTFLITGLLAVVLISAFVAIYVISTKQIKANYEEELSISKTALEDNTRQIYVAAKDIKLGSTITASDITATSAIVSIDASQLFTSADIGSIALVDIPADSLITTSMITYETYDNSLRETEFDVLSLPTNLENGSFVDVRIRYQNGCDYVILTKKQVKNLSLRNAICYMDLTEEETQLISSAIVDACLYDAVLYTNTYLEPGIQEASIVTYQPSEAALKNILDNPNIVEVAHKELSAAVREEIENKLKEYDEYVKNNGITTKPAGNLSDIPTVDDAANMQDTYVEDTYSEAQQSDEDGSTQIPNE